MEWTAEGVAEGVAGEGVGASEGVAGVLEEAAAEAAVGSSEEGISMLERSSPSSARMAISLPTGTPAAPLPTCRGGAKGFFLAPLFKDHRFLHGSRNCLPGEGEGDSD